VNRKGNQWRMRTEQNYIDKRGKRKIKRKAKAKANKI